MHRLLFTFILNVSQLGPQAAGGGGVTLLRPCLHWCGRPTYNPHSLRQVIMHVKFRCSKPSSLSVTVIIIIIIISLLFQAEAHR